LVGRQGKRFFANREEGDRCKMENKVRQSPSVRREKNGQKNGEGRKKPANRVELRSLRGRKENYFTIKRVRGEDANGAKTGERKSKMIRKSGSTEK